MSHLGYDFFSGVPDSTLAGVFKVLEGPQYRYVAAVREDNAIGVAVGAYLGGKQPAVLFQSSGLGVSIDALNSLACLYKVPLLLIIGWRGTAGDEAPEHRFMGRALPDVLGAIGITFWVPSREQLGEALQAASICSRREKTPSSVLVTSGMIE
jgi:sulfopyruvate decarboxylase subunit alpha